MSQLVALGRLNLTNVLYDDPETEIRVISSSAKDLAYLIVGLSKENVEELWVSHHFTAEDAIKMAFKESAIALTIEHKGIPVGIFGIMNPEEKRAEIYFLVTDSFPEIGRVFLRQARGFINNFLEIWPYLYGRVYNKSVKSIFWMKWCGAKMEDPQPWGIQGELFSRFYFERKI